MRFVYNSSFSLAYRCVLRAKRKDRLSTGQRCLTALKKEPEYIWLNDVSCVPLQQSLRHQQAAFANFFAGRVAYPAFKSKRHKQVAEFTASAFKHRDGELYIAKSKSPLDVRWSRELPSAPSTVTISRDSAGRYFAFPACVSLNLYQCLLPLKRSALGVGLKDLFVTDTGFKTDNPRHTAKYAKRLTLLQRRLSRKQKGSRNRIKARLKVARLHAKNRRLPDGQSAQVVPANWINENQVVCVESSR